MGISGVNLPNGSLGRIVTLEVVNHVKFLCSYLCFVSYISTAILIFKKIKQVFQMKGYSLVLLSILQNHHEEL